VAAPAKLEGQLLQGQFGGDVALLCGGKKLSGTGKDAAGGLMGIS